MNHPIYPNGIDGVTGEYLSSPNLVQKSSAFLQKLYDLSNYYPYLINQAANTQKQKFLGLPFGIDPLNVQRAGWGIVFSTGIPDDVRRSLNPLIEHRRNHIPPDRFKILEYKKGDDVKHWLKRHNVSPGNITPTKIPFYLLLIGDPTEIPFEFQYLLSIEYAVGRLSFDQPKQYAQYALSISSYEKHSTRNQRKVFFWAPRHDKATELSTDFLIGPLNRPNKNYDEKVSIAESLAYQSYCFIGERATKQHLSEILNCSKNTPALLFTASHGLGWPKGHKMQKGKQGALVCQDWKHSGHFNESHYFAASDIVNDAKLNGLVVFSFACYSAGTPAFDTFDPDFNSAHVSSQEAKQIAESPFIAALPQLLLSHPMGSALGFIGHVDRAWGFSIKPPNIDEQLIPFRNCIARILKGEPIGLATRDFAQRYAILSTALLNSLNKGINSIIDQEMVWAWIERNDAQNYITLGDPAARINI